MEAALARYNSGAGLGYDVLGSHYYITNWQTKGGYQYGCALISKP